MSSFRDRLWQSDSTLYTPNQVHAVLGGCGVEIVGETVNDYLCYCPFHGNTNTPSFSVSKDKGTFICFNGACNETGSLLRLVQFRTGKNEFEARRFIQRKECEVPEEFLDQLTKAMAPEPDFVEFPQDVLDRLYEGFWESSVAQEYMTGRGFTEETLKEFRIGYSAKKDMIAVPMHDPKGMPVGLIGRKPGEKAFKNSKKLPISKTLWNLHRAKRYGDTVIICEASFDAMRIHQAGYPNVVACLGGYFSKWHFELINRHFDRVIIMTDFDDKEKHIYQRCKKCEAKGLNLCVGHNPGRELGQVIAAGLVRKTILWASYEYGIVYPDGAKDAGDMTEEQIRQCVKNAVNNFEYQGW